MKYIIRKIFISLSRVWSLSKYDKRKIWPFNMVPKYLTTYYAETKLYMPILSMGHISRHCYLHYFGRIIQTHRILRAVLPSCFTIDGTYKVMSAVQKYESIIHLYLCLSLTLYGSKLISTFHKSIIYVSWRNLRWG